MTVWQRCTFKLTHLLVSDHGSLFTIKSCKTSIRGMELDEAISLLDCDLSKLSVLVENVENISLCHFFRWKVACLCPSVMFSRGSWFYVHTYEQPRVEWKPVPHSFRHIFSLLDKKFVIELLYLRPPSCISVIDLCL